MRTFATGLAGVMSFGTAAADAGDADAIHRSSVQALIGKL